MVITWNLLDEATSKEDLPDFIPGETYFEVYRSNPNDITTGTNVKLPRLTVQQRLDLYKAEAKLKEGDSFDEHILSILASFCQNWPTRENLKGFDPDMLNWAAVQLLYSALEKPQTLPEKTIEALRPGGNDIRGETITIKRPFWGVKKKIKQIGIYGPAPEPVLDEKGKPTGEQVDYRTETVKIEGTDLETRIYMNFDLESPNHMYKMRFAQYAEMVDPKPLEMSAVHEDTMMGVSAAFFSMLK